MSHSTEKGWNGNEEEPDYRAFSNDIIMKTIEKLAPQGEILNVQAFQEAIEQTGTFKDYVYTGNKPNSSWAIGPLNNAEDIEEGGQVMTTPRTKGYGNNLLRTVRAASNKLSRLHFGVENWSLRSPAKLRSPTQRELFGSPQTSSEKKATGS